MKNELIQCACGCGNLLYKYDKRGRVRKFINGHNAKLNPPNKKKEKPAQLCECGCGMLAKPGKRFIHGHHARVNNPMSSEHVRKKHKEVMASKEVRDKISNSLKGRIVSEETRKKLSEKLKGRTAYWMFGYRNVMNNPEIREKWEKACHNKDYKSIVEKQRQTNIKRYGVPNYALTQEFSESISGENHPNWKGGISPERQELYSRKEWKTVVNKVWKRDNATCQLCGAYADHESNKTFHIHHIISFQVKEKRMNLDNLILLCRDCHIFVHSNQNKYSVFIEDTLNSL